MTIDDAKRFVEEMYKRFVVPTNEPALVTTYGIAVDTLSKTVEEQEERIAIMSEGGWHKITDSPDSLPKKSGEYIVAVELTFICTGGKETKKRVSEQMEYDADFHDFTQNGGVFHPTHWMNLPKPPKEGEKA